MRGIFSKNSQINPIPNEKHLTYLFFHRYESQTNLFVLDHTNDGVIIACSALKKSYRQVIQGSTNIEFIYLKTDKKTIAQRLALRTNHFMPSSLLDSQFEALEAPKSGCILDATQTFEINADLVVSYLQKQYLVENRLSV